VPQSIPNTRMGEVYCIFPCVPAIEIESKVRALSDDAAKKILRP
jgi:hypothetical protein